MLDLFNLSISAQHCTRDFGQEIRQEIKINFKGRCKYNSENNMPLHINPKEFTHVHTHVAKGNTKMKLGKQMFTILPKE